MHTYIRTYILTSTYVRVCVLLPYIIGKLAGNQFDTIFVAISQILFE